MARVLHLVKSGDHAIALATIARQREAGDAVTVAVLPGGTAPDLPGGVTLHHVPDELSWEALLDLVFDADHVVTW
jgi:hypothetical protein